MPEPSELRMIFIDLTIVVEWPTGLLFSKPVDWNSKLGGPRTVVHMTATRRDTKAMVQGSPYRRPNTIFLQLSSTVLGTYFSLELGCLLICR